MWSAESRSTQQWRETTKGRTGTRFGAEEKPDRPFSPIGPETRFGLTAALGGS